MTTRLQNIANMVEADLSDRHCFFECFSEIHSESMQILEVQRQTLFREATEEVYRRDVVHNETAPRLHAKFRQNLHWLNSEGPNTTVFTETPGLKSPVSYQKSHDYELENKNCPPKCRNRETDHQGKWKIMELAMGRLKS